MCAMNPQAGPALEQQQEGSGQEDTQEEETWNRMSLTEDERNIAVMIKEAIAAAPEYVDPVSDFMCAQLALIDGDNTENALDRLHHLQCFKEEYEIADTPEDGRRCFAEYLQLFPGLHLSFKASDEIEVGGSNPLIVFDNTKFDAKRIRTEAHTRLWLSGTYYTCVAFCPDFEAIRSGAVMILENEGYEFQVGNMGLFKVLKRLMSEVCSVYPFTMQKVKYYHTGTAMNLVVSMIKPFMPKYMRDTVKVGCQFPHRLDQIYLVPTLEEANMRFLGRVEPTLKRRYENERTFRL